MDHHLEIAGRLEDRAATIERPPQLHRVRQIAVLGDGEAAVVQFREEGLGVADARTAGCRIAHVPDRGRARKHGDDVVAVEIAGDVAHRLVGMEMLAVEAADSSRFLAAVLQRVEPQCDEARRMVGTPDSENAALLAQLVVIERIGRQHVPGPKLLRGIVI
jgi:hypothetical protein